MVVEEVQEGVENPTIPYVGKLGGIAGAVGLFIGLMLMKMLDPAADSAADWVSAQIAGITGVNPQTGETGGNTAPIGGA